MFKVRSDSSRMAVFTCKNHLFEVSLSDRDVQQHALPGKHTASNRGKLQDTLANAMALVALKVLSSSSMNSKTDREQHPAVLAKDEI